MGCTYFLHYESVWETRANLYLSLLVAQIGVVCGPLVGGALTEYVTWRWCKHSLGDSGTGEDAPFTHHVCVSIRLLHQSPHRWRRRSLPSLQPNPRPDPEARPYECPKTASSQTRPCRLCPFCPSPDSTAPCTSIRRTPICMEVGYRDRSLLRLSWNPCSLGCLELP